MIAEFHCYDRLPMTHDPVTVDYSTGSDITQIKDEKEMHYVSLPIYDNTIFHVSRNDIY